MKLFYSGALAFCLLLGGVAFAEAPTSPAATSTAPVQTSADTPAFKALLSSSPDAHSALYEIQKGDNLTKIAKKNGVTVDLIKKINGMTTDKVLPGKKIKIPSYKFAVVVDKSQNTLILKGGEEVLKTYIVSTGTNNSTPVGIFKITDKLIDPTWYTAGAVVPSGSPKNVLGTRWMGITKEGFGIHGTTEPEKLGQQVTAGCVRMKNSDVEELYSILPSGTEVTIVD